jgi:hypothetical protein
VLLFRFGPIRGGLGIGKGGFIRRACAIITNQTALRPGASVDIPLGLLDRPMAGELLHVAQASAGFEHQARRIGDESATP